MNAIQFEHTKYGYKANVAGLLFHVRRVNRPDEPGLFVVYSRDWPENTCGDLIDAREWLNDIIDRHAADVEDGYAEVGLAIPEDDDAED